MANYDYKCRKCNTVVGVTHPVNDSPVILCANCGVKLMKVLSAPGLEFKGTGWGKD
jgi:putative FmdB family regulatory protein